jgi:hypothetical protein
MSSIPGIHIGIGGTSLGCGLTSDQIRDCYAANRSPRTGRRLRTSPNTPLEIKSKRVNWAKLMITGAISNLHLSKREIELTTDQHLAFNITLAKLEKLMLEELDKSYAEFKSRYLADKASK